MQNILKKFLAANKNRVVLFLFVWSSFTSLAQSKKETDRPVYGAYGKDVRIKASFGLLPDAQYRKFPKLSNFQGHKIGLLLLQPDEIVLSRKPFFPTEILSTDLGFKSYKLADSLITASFLTSEKLNGLIKKVDTTSVQSLVKSRSAGVMYIPLKGNEEALKILKEENDIDLLLVISGGKIPDFISTSGIGFGAQGLFKHGPTYVYAGHRMSIIDLSTGKQIPKAFCLQASADYSSVEFKKTFENYTADELQTLKTEIDERIKNNFAEMVKILID